MGTKIISDIAMWYGDRRNNGDYDNGIWMDLLDTPFLKTIDQAEPYDVVIHTMWLDAIGWHRELKTRFPSKTLLGLSDHPLSTHISKLSGDKQLNYIADLQYLDGIMALTDEEVEWYQTAVPSKPVIKVGLPFPFENYEEKYGHFRQQEKKFIGLGVGASDNDRNFITSAIIFNKLRLLNPDLQGVFMSIPSHIVPYCSYIADAFEGIYIHERESMEAFYTILSQCKFVINMADRNTPGRLVGEAAFFGVPVIGSNRLELQNELFPELAITPYQANQAFEIGHELLSNDKWRESITTKAYKKLQKYNYKESEKRFNELLELAKERVK